LSFPFFRMVICRVKARIILVARIRCGNCPGEMSLHVGCVRHRDRNGRGVSRVHSGCAAMKLRVAVQAVAICCVIAVMAWTKAHGFTGVIP